MRADRHERDDQLATRGAEVARYRTAIGAVWSRAPLESGQPSALDQGLRSGLRELGYAALEAGGERLPSPLAAGDLPSPTERKAELQAFYDAVDLAYAGQLDPAIAAMRALHERQPQSLTVASLLAGTWTTRKLGRPARCSRAWSAAASRARACFSQAPAAGPGASWKPPNAIARRWSSTPATRKRAPLSTRAPRAVRDH